MLTPLRIVIKIQVSDAWWPELLQSPSVLFVFKAKLIDKRYYWMLLESNANRIIFVYGPFEMELDLDSVHQPNFIVIHTEKQASYISQVVGSDTETIPYHRSS